MRILTLNQLDHITDWNNADKALLILSPEEHWKVEEVVGRVKPSDPERLFGADMISKAIFQKAIRDGLIEKKEEGDKFVYCATLSWLFALKNLLGSRKPAGPTIIRRGKRVPLTPKAT